MTGFEGGGGSFDCGRTGLVIVKEGQRENSVKYSQVRILFLQKPG